MHTIEPYYNWRGFYTSENDSSSPFFGRKYSEFEFSNQIYNYVIHPQWDNFDSTTLFIKILYVDYEENFAIIEFFGEWNDCIYNDIMNLKRNVIDDLNSNGINKFILIAENVFNFHFSDDCYYEEWFDDVEDGWIALVNPREHVLEEFEKIGIDQYFVSGGNLNEVSWRKSSPDQLFEKVSSQVLKRIA